MESQIVDPSNGTISDDKTCRHFTKFHSNGESIEVEKNATQEHKNDILEDGINSENELLSFESETEKIANVSQEGQSPLKYFDASINASKSDEIQQYFTIISNSKARCKLCNKVLSYTCRSYYNLSLHLRELHIDILSSENLEFLINVEKHNQNTLNSSKKSCFEMIRTEVEFEDINNILEKDHKLKKCFKFEEGSLVCKSCLEIFTFFDESLLKGHLQIYHSKWQVLCSENRDSESSVNDTDSEMAENKINSVRNSPKNNKIKADEKYKNIWKYFSKITASNVRCNFCTIVFTYSTKKKWNMFRHLYFKHSLKLDKDDLKLLNYSNPSPRRNHSISDKKIADSFSSLKAAIMLSEKSKLKVKKSSEKKCDSPSTPKTPSSKKIINGLNKINSTLKNSSSKKTLETSTSQTTNTSIKYDSDEEYGHIKNKKVFIDKIGRTWSHFTKVHLGKAICNMCHMSIHYFGNGGDILNKHLDDFHVKKRACKFDKNYDSSRNLKNPIANNKINSNNLTLEKANKLVKNTPITKNATINTKNKSSIEKYHEKLNKPVKFTPIKKNARNDTKNKSSVEKPNEKVNKQVKPLSTKKNTSIDTKNKSSIEKNNKSDKEKFINNLSTKKNTSRPIDTKNKSSSIEKYNKSEKYIDHSDTAFEIESKSKVWMFFSKNENGVANCQLCLKSIPYKGSLFDLIFHLHHTHSVISIPLPENEDLKLHEEENKDLSQKKLIPLNKKKLLDVKEGDNIWSYFSKLNKHRAKCEICYNSLSFKGGAVFNLKRHLYNIHAINVSKLEDKPPVNKNDIWSYFIKMNQNYGKCKICNKLLSYKGGKVFNLRRHLLNVHSIKIPMNETKTPEIGKNIHNNIVKDVKTKTDVRILNFCKSKRDILTFFSKINRNYFKCKLCKKHFLYQGLSTKRLMTHLWSTHINKFMAVNNKNVKLLSKEKLPVKTCIRKKTVKNFLVEDVLSSTANKSAKDNKTMKKIDSKQVAKPVKNLINSPKTTTRILRNRTAKSITCGELNDSTINCSPDLSVKISEPPKSKVKSCKINSTIRKSDSKQMTKVSDKNDVNKGIKNIWQFFIKINKSKAQCVICKDRKTYEIKHLQQHLSSVHQNGKSSLKHNMLNNKISTNKIQKENVKSLKVKCKLCFGYLIYTKNSRKRKLIKHLKIHIKRLLEEEYQILNKKSNQNVKNVKLVNVTGVNKIIKKYFKYASYGKNKCKMCHKFVSSKIKCTHLVNGDISISYGVKRTLENNDKCGFIKKRRMNRNVNVNLPLNKCSSCDVSTRNQSLCCHLIRKLINNQDEKSVEDSEEMKIMTDALSSKEDKIIIITDNLNQTFLNSDLLNFKNDRIDSDQQRKVSNVDQINIEDLEVVYDFNPDDYAAAASHNQKNYDEDFEEIKKFPEQLDDKELEQVNVIIDELISTNQCNLNFNEVSIEIDREKINNFKDTSVKAIKNQLVKQTGNDKVIVEKIETADMLSKRLCDSNKKIKSIEKFFNVNPGNSLSDNILKTSCKSPNIIVSKNDDVIKKEINIIDINKPVFEHNIKDQLNRSFDSNLSNVAHEEVVGDIDENTEEIRNNLSEEKKYAFDLKQEVKLQNLLGLPIDKNIINFVNLKGDKQFAECNLCKKCLLLRKPIIRNFISHLYFKHKHELSKEYQIKFKHRKQFKVRKHIVKK